MHPSIYLHALLFPFVRTPLCVWTSDIDISSLLFSRLLTDILLTSLDAFMYSFEDIFICNHWYNDTIIDHNIVQPN